MLQRLSLPRNVVLLTAAILLCYLGVWVGYDHLQRVDSDFMGTYLASWLLISGHRTELYDPAVQRWAHDLLVGHVPGNGPFVNMPLAAAIAVPATLLAPAAAYTTWSTVQFMLVVVAVVVAYRAAPRATGLRAIEGLAIVLLVLSNYAVFDLVRAGQWDGLNALGVAMAYRAWRLDRLATGSAWLVVTAALAKPHLALGLLAFIVGWRNRRALAGAAAAAVSVGVASIGLVGVGGASASMRLVSGDAHAASVRGQASFVALAGGWAGDGPWTFKITYAGIGVIVGLCILLGHRVRQGLVQLGPALAAATGLSLLAAPHSFIYDTVMLAPAVAWLLTERSPFSADVRARRQAWATALLWHGATALYFLNQIVSPTVLRVGTPSIWLEVALIALLWRIVHAAEGPGPAWHVAPAPMRPLPGVVPAATTP